MTKLSFMILFICVFVLKRFKISLNNLYNIYVLTVKEKYTKAESINAGLFLY